MQVLYDLETSSEIKEERSIHVSSLSQAMDRKKLHNSNIKDKFGFILLNLNMLYVRMHTWTVSTERLMTSAYLVEASMEDLLHFHRVKCDSL